MARHSWLNSLLGRKVQKSPQTKRTAPTALELLEDRLAPATLFWDPDGNTANNDLVTGAGLGGAGTWDTTTANTWVDASNNSVLWSNGNDAAFRGTAGAVTLGSPISATSVTFSTTGYSVGSNTLSLTGGHTITTDPGVTATITSALGGSVGLIKEGTGTLTSATANTYTGGTVVNAGTLKLDLTARSTNSALNVGTITTNSPATLELFTNGPVSYGSTALFSTGSTFTGNGTIVKSGTGIVDFWNGSSVKDFAGLIDIQAGQLANQTNGAGAWSASAGNMSVNIAAGAYFDLRTDVGAVIDKLTGSGTIGGSFSAGMTLTVGAQGGSSTFAGVIQNTVPGFANSPTIALVKTGAGAITFTNNNTYTGSTAVNQGMLQVGNNSVGVAHINNSASVSIASNATFRFFRGDTANLTLLNTFSGAGNIRLSGLGATDTASQWTTSQNNSSFTGRWVLDGARLNVSAQNSLGASSTVEVQANGQLLVSGSVTYANNIIVTDSSGWRDSGFRLGAIRMEGNSNLSGNIALNQTNSVVSGDNSGLNAVLSGYSTGDHILSGVISGTGEFSLSRFTSWNGGTTQNVNFTLSGSASNTYTGRTVVDGQGAKASLILAKTGGAKAIGGGAAGNVVQFGINTGGQANLRMGGDNQFGADVVLNFSSSGGHHRFDLKGTAQTIAGINAGTTSTQALAVIQNQGIDAVDPGADATLTLNGSGTYIYNGWLRDQDNGLTTRKLNVVKDGSGTQTFAGGNVSYQGTTQITSVANNKLVLSAAGAYASPTTVTSATLELAGAANVDHPSTFSLTLNSATLLKSNTGYDTFNSSNIIVSGSSAINISNNGSNNQLFIGGAGTGLTGTGTLAITNTGTATTGLTFRTGVNATRFSGAISVNGGVINVGSGASLALDSADVTLTGAILNLGNASFAASAGPASVKSLTGNTASTIPIGAQTLTIGTNDGTGGVFAGVISGSGGLLVKTGSGVQTLSGTNTYTGGTTVSNGTLRLGNVAGAGTGAITLGDANTLANNVAVLYGSGGSPANAITVANLGSGTATVGTYGGTFTTFTNTLTLGRATTLVDATGDRTTFTGKLTGNVGMLTIASGRITLDNTTNDFVGDITINTGAKLQINSGGGVIPDATNVTANGTLQNGGGTNETIAGLFGTGTVEAANPGGFNLTVGGNNASGSFSGILKTGASGGHLIKTGAGTQILTNATSTFNQVTDVNDGVLQLGDGTNNGTAGTAGINLNSATANVTFNNGTAQVFSQTIAGSGSLTKTGAGTLTLTGVNTYSAGTTLNASSGSIIATVNTAQNSIGTGPASIGAGSTLQLNNTNTSGSNVTIGNTFSGLGTLQLNFAANTTARNTFMQNVSGLTGSGVRLTSSGATGDKWGMSGTITAPSTPVVIESGSQLFVAAAATFGTITLSGTGNSENRGAIRLTSNLTANLSLAGNTTIGGEGGILTGNISPNVTGTTTLTVGTANSNNLANNMLSGVLSDGAGVLALNVYNHNGGGVFINGAALNTYSGGTLLLNNGSGGTRLVINGISGTPYGTGAITIGQAATDRAGIFFHTTPNQTLTNNIVFNTALGTDRAGIRSDITGIILSGQITANAAATFSTNGTGSFTLTGRVTGAQGLTLDNSFGTTITVTLNNAAANNNYQGDTNIAGTKGVLVLGASNQIPDGAGTGNVLANGTLRLDGFSDTINGLSGAGTVDGFTGSPVLTVGANDATGLTFSGTMRNTAGNLALVKTGAGTQTLSGANITYTGNTTINNGQLILVDARGFNSPATVNAPATLEINSSVAFSTRWNYSKTLSGNGTLNKTGTGVFGIIGSMSMSGQINIQAGRLHNDNVTGNWTANTADVDISAGAVLDLRANDITVDSLTGSGEIWNSHSAGGNADTLFIGVSGGSGTYSGIIRGNDSQGDDNPDAAVLVLVKQGAGMEVLSGANTYTGSTTITGGVLSVPSLTGVGPLTGGGWLAIQTGGTFQYTGTGAETRTGLFYVNSGSGTIDVPSAAGNASFVSTGGDVASGGGTFTKSGPGTFTFSTAIAGNNNADTFKAVSITGGTLALAATNAATKIRFNVSVSGAAGTQINILAGPGVVQNDNNVVNWTANLADLDVASGGVFDLYADPVYVNRLTGLGTVRNTYGNTGGFSGAAASTERLYIGVNGGSSTFDGVFTDAGAAGSGVNGGLLEIQKNGSGTIILTGASNYKGRTNVTGGTLEIATGGVINNGSQILVGGTGSPTPTLAITGGSVTSSLNSGNSLYVGATASQPGAVTISSGSLTLSGASSSMTIGDNAAGTFTQTGGTVMVAGQTWIGNNANSGGSAISVSGGSFSTSLVYNGVRSSTMINVSGTGSLTTGTLNFGHPGGTATGTRTVNLDGGTLQVSTFTYGLGTHVFNFNGGTLRAGANNASFWTNNGNVTATVKSGGAIVDTNGFAVTIAQPLVAGTPSGGLTKTGAGTLTLTSQLNTYSGDTTISQGTISASGINQLTTASNKTLNLGDANTGSANVRLVMNGNFTLGAVTVSSNAGGTNTLEIATAAGTVNVGAISLGKPLTLSMTGSGLADVQHTAATNVITGGTAAGSDALTIHIANSGSTMRSSLAAATAPGAINFTGNVHVTGLGTWQMQNTSYIANDAAHQNLWIPDASSMTVDTGSRWTITHGVETIDGLSGGGIVANVGGTNYLAGAQTLTVGAGGASSTFGGVIQNNGLAMSLAKTGAGTLTLTNTNPYTGATMVNGGTLLVDGSIASSTVTVNNTATLGGNGAVGPVNVDSGGTLAPGSSPGDLASGNVSFAGGSNFSVEIQGAVAGSGYDQLIVAGTVTLGTAVATLNITATAGNPTIGATYTIIDNDGADLVSGYFKDPSGNPLPEGALVGTFNTVPLYITYNGGDGNDVQLVTGPVVNGTPGNDSLVVRQKNATQVEYSFNGLPFVAIDATLTLTFNGQGGVDQLLVDLATASTFNGHLQLSGESLRVQGGAANVASFQPSDANKVHAASGFINYTGTPSIDFVGLGTASVLQPAGAIGLTGGATTANGATLPAGYTVASQPALTATAAGISVRFVGNTLTKVDTGLNAGDVISVSGVVTSDGNLELTGFSLGGSGTLAAPALDATAEDGIALNTTVASLTAKTFGAAANIAITETDAITLTSVTTFGGSVAVSAGGDINVGKVAAQDSTVSLQVTGASGSVLDIDNDAAVDIDGPFGITLVAKGTGTIGSSTNALELGSGGVGAIDALSAQTENQNIYLDIPAGDARVLKLNAVTGGGLVPATSSGNITMRALAGNFFMDSDAWAGGADIVGNSVTLVAVGDLGQNDHPLELNAITLITTSSPGGLFSGAQFLAEADSVAIGLSGLNPGAASVNLEKLGAGPAVYNFSSGNTLNDAARLNLADGVQVVLADGETLGALGDYPGHVVAGDASFAEIFFTSQTLTVGVNDADTSYSGILTGAGGQFIKLGAGRFTEIDNGTNTYTGQTTVMNGTLTLAKTGGGNKAIAGPIVIGDSVGLAATTVLEIAASEQIADLAAISFVSIDGRLLVNAGATETLTTPTDFAQGDVKIAGTVITTNDYAQNSGTTTLGGGTLRVGPDGTNNSSLGSQATPGGTLQGSGTIYTNILTSYGTIDPSSGVTDLDVGNKSPGRITIRGNLQMTDAAVTNLDVSAAGSDQLNVGINTALPLPAGSYTNLSNYDLDPYLRGDVAAVTEQGKRGINDLYNVNGTVRFAGTLNTRPIGNAALANNVTYGNSMNFVWRALNVPVGTLNPRGGNLSSLPSDFAVKNSRDVNGNLVTSGTRFDERYMGSAGQYNAIGQSVSAVVVQNGVPLGILTAPAFSVGQAKSMTLTSLTGNASVDTTQVKVTKQFWNAMRDSHTRVTLTVTNTTTSTQTGPFYVELTGIPAGAKAFNPAGVRPSSGNPYLVVPATSLAAGAAVTLEVDLLTPVTLSKYATLTLQVLRGGMP